MTSKIMNHHLASRRRRQQRLKRSRTARARIASNESELSNRSTNSKRIRFGGSRRLRIKMRGG